MDHLEIQLQTDPTVLHFALDPVILLYSAVYRPYSHQLEPSINLDPIMDRGSDGSRTLIGIEKKKQVVAAKVHTYT